MNEYDYTAFPYPCFQLVTKFLNPKEICNLALRTNDKVLTRLAELPSRPRNVTFDVLMETELKTISLQFEDSTQNFKILFAEAVDPVADITVITSHGAAQLLGTFRNVRKLFNGSVSQMTIDLGVLDMQTLSGLVETPCAKFSVKGVSDNIPKEEIAEALKKVKATRECCIDSDIGLKVLPTLPSQKLSIKFAYGISGTDLLNMAGKTREIELLESTFTDDDVHMFINAWFRSTETTTISLKVHMKNLVHWEFEHVLRDIPYSQFRVETRQKNFVTRRSESGVPEAVESMLLGRDIVRADGLIASVRITQTELFFCVWHNPHEIQNKLDEFIRRKTETSELLDAARIRFNEAMVRSLVRSFGYLIYRQDPYLARDEEYNERLAELKRHHDLAEEQFRNSHRELRRIQTNLIQLNTDLITLNRFLM